MIEKILTLLNNLTAKVYIPCGVPADKQSHFIYGALTYIAAYFVIGYWAVLLVSAIGVAKEVYDHFHPDKHTCDFFDWLATTLGGVAGLVLLVLVNRM